jgi:predicted oxidoreductase
MKNVIIAGSGNAALCAGIADLEAGAHVLILEKADEALSGGNTKYTAGAMRFCPHVRHRMRAQRTTGYDSSHLRVIPFQTRPSGP